jgi:phosphohistidine phosphatase
MKTVTLFRHAKAADKANPNVDDFDRPLAGRGLKAAARMGAALRNRRLWPELILCSPSVRTRQTLALAQAMAWDAPPKTRFEKKIYEATPETLLKLLKEAPEDAGHVMLIGHNPGLQDLAASLAQPGPLREQLMEKLPTGAVVSLKFDLERWKDIKSGSARVALFLTPSMLSPSGQE